MHHKQRCERGKFNRPVSVCDTIQRVQSDAVHTQLISNEFTVERISGAGQCAGPKRGDVRSGDGLVETIHITAEHLNVCHEIVRECDRLGTLKVCISRHICLGISLRDFYQSITQEPEQ